MKLAQQRGLTLLEVVLAIALLSALTVAVLPMLIDATQAATPKLEGVDPTDLHAFSESFVKDEASARNDESKTDEKLAVRILAGEETVISWHDRDESRKVLIRRIVGSDLRSAHDWLEFSCGEVRVLRYVRRPDLKAGAVATAGMLR